VFVDAGVAVDQTNFQNISTSYYTYGGAIALALDLTLRQQNKTLDQFMQQMWKVHGKPEKPYTVADMQTALSVITTPAFAKDFFDKYVYAPGKPNYETLLAQAGFAVQKGAPGKAYIGSMRVFAPQDFRTPGGGNELAITGNTVRGTPLYDVGLDIGDVLLTVDGQPVKREADLTAILNAHQPGDKLTLTYRHRTENKEATLTAGESPIVNIIPYEKTGQPLTDAMKAFRKNWLGAK
jgi:predicted metalloprotease with PDZ domain